MKRATPYLLLFPALLFTVFVLAYPLAQNLFNSFHSVSLVRGTGDWVGFGNFEKVFQDAVFWLAFWNTLVYATVGTVLALVIGLAFALLLNLKIGPITSVMNVIYTIPWVISPVVAGFAWKWLLNDNFGIVNHWLVSLGLINEEITWLGSADTALACVIIARLWQFYPFAMVMFLAGLQSIPHDQYEAAAVDGATAFQKFFHITLPNLQSVTAVLLLLGTIWSFNDFNIVFVMTRGGPINASMVLPVLVREFSFVQFDLGKGSALSIVIFFLLISLSLVYLKIISRREPE
ncbi:MAG: transporter permease subunit [Bacteroidetes bacterium]|jgi:multiple sugar transport system permease protein|nr:transporter permease subunit [Bacteroidota bacterium]